MKLYFDTDINTKQELNNMNNNMININHYNKINNPYLTDINWIKYNKYFCRYNSFLTMFIFCIYQYILLFNTKINIHIKLL